MIKIIMENAVLDLLIEMTKAAELNYKLSMDEARSEIDKRDSKVRADVLYGVSASLKKIVLGN